MRSRAAALISTFAAVALAAVLLSVVLRPGEARITEPAADGAPPEIQEPEESVTATWESDLKFHDCCEESIEQVDFARGDGAGFRSYLRYGDPQVADGTRAEVHTGDWEESHFSADETVYYGFSVYVVSNWETDSTEDIVFQWHTQPDECEDEKYPTAFLSIQPEGLWRLRVNSDDEACTTGETMERHGFDLAQVTPGTWNDFVFEYQWDYTDAGAINVWHQTAADPGWEQVLSTTGPNAFNDDSGVHGYLKWGIYKPSWNYGPTDVDSRVLVHDNVAFGNSFAAVDPSGEL